MAFAVDMRRLYVCLPEQFTAVGVILVVDCFLQNTAEMKGQPAESENQHKAKHCLRYFPPLHTQKTNIEITESLCLYKSYAFSGSEGAQQSFAHVPVSCGR